MYTLCSFKKILFILTLHLALFVTGGLFTVAKAGESVALSWDSNPEPDIAGYRVRYGQTSGNLEEMEDSGGAHTEIVISSLTPGDTYYFAVLAYNQQGVEGPLSDEISYEVPRPNPEVPAMPVETPELAVESSSAGFLAFAESIAPAPTLGIGSSVRMATLTLHNRGKAKLRGLTLNLSGPGAASFSTSALSSDSLAAGASLSIAVNFAPTGVGSHAAVLHVSSNDPTHPRFDLALAGMGVDSPRFAVADSLTHALSPGNTLAFGSLELGTDSDPKILTIRNSGTAPMAGLTALVSGLGAVDFQLAPWATTTLAPGESTQLKIVFKPHAAGSSRAQIQLSCNDTRVSNFELLLSGSALSLPRIELMDHVGKSLPVGLPVLAPAVVLGGSGRPITYTIRNSGTAPLTRLSVSTTGPAATSFITTQPRLKSLAPGASTTFNVTFHPSSGGWATAKVRVSSSISGSAREISLKANALTVPAIRLTGPDRQTLAAAGAVVNFGSRDLIDKSVVRTFTLKNTGSAALTGLRFTRQGDAADFEVIAPKSKSLAPGRSAKFSISFAPTRTGMRAAVISIASNASGPPREFTVSGSGVAAPEIQISLGKRELDKNTAYVEFGKGQIGETGSTETLVISNVGSAPLKNISLSKTGISRSEFSMSHLPGRTLAPGKSARFNVTFRARKSGIRWAGIRVSSNDGDEDEFEIILTGTGTTGKVTFKKGGKSGKASAAPAPQFAKPAPVAAPVISVVRIDGQKFRMLTLSRSASIPLAAADVQVSSDRVEWASGTRHTTVLRDDAQLLQVRDNIPLTQNQKRFIRLKD